jgi:hypothetical protein
MVLVFVFFAIIPSFVICVVLSGDYAGCGFLNLLERGGLPIGKIIPGPPIPYYPVFFLFRIPFFFCFGLVCRGRICFQPVRSPQICHNRLLTLAIFFHYFPFLIGVKRLGIGMPIRFPPLDIIHRDRSNLLAVGCPLGLLNQPVDGQSCPFQCFLVISLFFHIVSVYTCRIGFFRYIVQPFPVESTQMLGPSRPFQPHVPGKSALLVNFRSRFFISLLNLPPQFLEIRHNGFFHFWAYFFSAGGNHRKQPLQRPRLPKPLAIYPIHPRVTYAAGWHRAGLPTTPSRIGPCVLVVAMLLNMAPYSLNIFIRRALLSIIPYGQFRNCWYNAIRKSDAFYVGC